MSIKEREFLEKLAKSSTGRQLVDYLQGMEIKYADMRSLKDVPETERVKKLAIRLDAIEMMREGLLDKLLVLSGEVEPPDGDEFS